MVNTDRGGRARAPAARGAVVVVGSINQDQVLAVGHRPAPGETVTDAVLAIHAGGKGANQAVAAARRGAAVMMVGRVGRDPAGEAQRSALAAQGVDVALVATTAQAATGSAFVTVTPDGENAIVVAPGANAALTAADVEAAGVFISSAAVLVVQLEVPIAAVERAAELAGPATTVVLNAAPISVLPPSLLSRVGVLVLNEHEAAALLDQPAGGVAAASEAAAALLARGPRAVVVTMGPDGAVAAEAGSCIHVPAPAVRVVDTTGAGDAFVGAMAASLAAGATLVDAVTAGVALGSTAVGRPGAQGLLPAPDVGGASSRGAGLTASEAGES